MNNGGIDFVRVSDDGSSTEQQKQNSVNAEARGKDGTVNPIAVAFEIILLLIAAAASVLPALCISVTYDYIHTEQPTYLTLSEASPDIPSIDEIYVPGIGDVVEISYDFDMPTPEGQAVGYEYFNDTVFIGDSRITGLIKYTDLSPYDFSSVGTNVRTVKTKPFIRMRNDEGELQSYTLYEALERERGNYKAIYIALGLNELGWNVNTFIAEYRALVNDLRAIADVPIYAQLIMPVTTESSETTRFSITNENAAVFNEKLRALCTELSLFCLDPAPLFIMEDGTLDPEYAADGVHLHPFAYKMLADYYATHTVDVGAYDNTKYYIDNIKSLKEAPEAAAEA